MVAATGGVTRAVGLPRSRSGADRGSTGPPLKRELRKALSHHRAGRPQDAAALCWRILDEQPDHPDALYLLATIAHRIGNPAAALALIDKAVRLAPARARYHNDRGAILQRQGSIEEAVAAFDDAIAIQPEHADAHTNRGVGLLRLERAEEAIAAHDEALRIRPDHAVAHLNRGAALRRLGRLTEAIAAYDQALRLRPDFAQAHNNRASALQDQGRLDEARAAYQAALGVEPNYGVAHSNYLFCLNFDPAEDAAALAAPHRAWGERHGRHPDAFTAYANLPDPDRPLCVGLVSSDFGRHPVGYFLEPLLTATRPGRLRFVCYSGRLRDDDLTLRLKASAFAWRSTLGVADAALAETVRADRIDILVDLVGHTAANRLGCFALRPAPVHVHWAGYCHSVAPMDASLWDPVQVPKGDERWFAEPVVRLPDIRWCYGPPEYAPEVAEPPVLRQGYVTFGSFNNLAKVNQGVLDLWARVLEAAPGARLLLSWPTLADAREAERLGSRLSARGIAPERLELRRGASAHAGVLAEYAAVDIALDPFPFSGCLTTFEALWMGVPVVTLPRTRPASRQSQAFLAALGRNEWIASDPDDYIRIAAALASDPGRLAAVRRGQRARMAASPVCDGPRFARHFEAALRALWRGWCARPAGPAANDARGRRDHANAGQLGKSRRRRAALLAGCFALWALLPAVAPAEERRPVRSLLEMRRDKVVVQSWDLSCGAAALATLLNYQHGDPVTEREVAKGLIGREEYLKDPSLVRVRHGFSLLDLKRYVDSRGYQGIGYGRLTLEDLIEHAPIMVPLRLRGYNHFVVFRGARGNRVLLADPAFGNRTMLVDQFEDAWLEFPKFGKVGFVVAAPDGSMPPNQLAPRPGDFVALF